jgi:peptide/nickel transport system substrate-binding protein
MPTNPILTVLKILAFAALAFLVGVSTCQKANLENRMTAVETALGDVHRSNEEVRRALEAGGGVRPAGTPAAAEPPSREVLDASADPSKPLGTPGRYKDFLSDDPTPEIPPEAAGHMDGEYSRWFGPEPKGFNLLTDRSGDLNMYVETYVSDSFANRHRTNPSKWSPALCWRVEVSPDYREWTCFLRKGVLWHPPSVDLSKHPHLQGRHYVTARDAKFTLDMINNPQSEAADLRSYYSDVESTQALNDEVLVVRWKKTLFHSISFMLSWSLMPEFLFAYDEQGQRFPESSLGTSFNDHWYNRVGVCGNGPYRFASFESGQQIVLERFEDWYGIKQLGLHYPIAKHRLFVFPDTGTNLLKLKAGEIRLTDNLQAPQWKNEVLDNTDPKSPFRDGRIEHWIGKSANFLYFGWRNTDPLFSDRNVRKALALACNREQIARDIFLGRYRVMASPVYPDSPEADPDLKPLPFDLAEARRLLDEAGWKLGSDGLRGKTVEGSRLPFEFTLYWPGPSPDFEAALNQYKADLLSIGVKMNPQSMEWAVFQKKLKDREFKAFSLLWTTNGWEHDFEQIWHSRGIQDPGSSNYIYYSNPELDRLSDDLRQEMDLQKRIEKIRRIGRLLYEDQPYCFFGWRNGFGANWSDLKNVQGSWYFLRPFLRAFPMYVARP